MTPFSNTALHLYGIYTIKEEYKFKNIKQTQNLLTPKSKQPPPAPQKKQVFWG